MMCAGRQTIMITYTIYLQQQDFWFSTNRPLANPFLIYYTRFHPRCYIPQNPPLISFAPTQKREVYSFSCTQVFFMCFFTLDQELRFFFSPIFFSYDPTVRFFAIPNITTYGLYTRSCRCERNMTALGLSTLLYFMVSVNTQRDILLNKFLP